MAITASIIAASAAVSAGTSIYSASQSAKAGKKAENAANDQALAQKKLLDEAAAKSATDTSIADRDAARKKQRQAASAAQGRSETLLTSPLGVVGQNSSSGKTLLGS